MSAILSAIHPDRTGETTDTGLRACARSVLGRPGWAAREGITPQGETGLRPWTGQGSAAWGEPDWRIRRVARHLVPVHVAGGQTNKPAATMQEALTFLWVAGQDDAEAA